MSNRSGFTVWEVLGVCAILFVVALFLFPIFANSHRPPSGVYCASNEKQLGLAFMQYAQDNNEQFPRGTQGGGVGWAGQVYPYVKSTGVYRCPDDTTKGTAQRYPVSYGYNADIAQHPQLSHDDDAMYTVLLFEVSSVAADVALTDEDASHGATAFSAAGDGTDGTLVAGHAPNREYATGDLGNRPSANPTQIGQPRHHGLACTLFADGSVKEMAPTAISSGRTAPAATSLQTGTLHGTAAGTSDSAYTGTFSVK